MGQLAGMHQMNNGTLVLLDTHPQVRDTVGERGTSSGGRVETLQVQVKEQEEAEHGRPGNRELRELEELKL